ncbi:hypothetical protein [Burkholderia ubonensis]|uniref:hypothetical protein n=1 Tax=Burkholderia ubonensis TaxID=101571 RepID=UPI000B27A19C|nr:hypothetical protein [Burkholderia ubonensis]
MADNVEGIAKFVDALRSIPLWLFAGLAVAAGFVLTLPPLGVLPAPVLNAFRDR